MRHEQVNLERFLEDLDHAWGDAGGPPLELRVIGSTALFLQTEYERGTKDSDVLETTQITPELQEELQRLAGPGSALHTKHRVYLDVVKKGIPMLPPEPLWHYYNLRLENFTLYVLDVADVVASKLKRFNHNDRDDIQNMIYKNQVNHNTLVSRFREIINRYRFDGMSHHLHKMAKNLNEAEKDWFLVEETLFPELEDLDF